MKSPGSILKLWNKLSSNHDSDNPKQATKSKDQKLAIRKGLTLLKTKAGADMKEEASKTAFVKTRNGVAGVMRKYCRYLATNKKAERESTYEKYLKNVKKLAAVVIKLEPGDLDLTEAEMSLDSGLTNATIDTSAVDLALKDKDTDPETFDFDALDAPKSKPEETKEPTPTVNRLELTNRVAKAEKEFKELVASKKIDAAVLTKDFEKVHGHFAKGELHLAVPIVDKIEKVLKDPPPMPEEPTSTDNRVDLIKRVGSLEKKFKEMVVGKKIEESVLAKVFESAHGRIAKGELDLAVPIVDEIERVLTAPAVKAQNLELAFFRNRLKAVESQIPGLKKDLDKNFPTGIETGLTNAKNAVEKLDFKTANAELMKVEKLITTAKAARQIALRPKQLEKDFKTAKPFLEQAKNVDVNQALEQRRKLIELRKKSPNVFGVLQEAPLDDARQRRQIYEDRLSQSGTTMVEHVGAGRFDLDYVDKQLTQQSKAAAANMKKAAEGLVKQVVELLKDEKTKGAVAGLAMPLAEFIKKVPCELKDVKQFQAAILGKLPETVKADPALLADAEDSLQAVETFAKLKKGLEGATPRKLSIPASKEEAKEASRKKLKALLTEGDAPWKKDRVNEIDATIERQKKEIAQLESINSPDVEQKKKDLLALQKDKETIEATLKDFPKAVQDFKTKFKGRWGQAKKEAKTNPEAAKSMKAARWLRQELMNDALENTAIAFLQKSAKEMGIDENALEIEELPPQENPNADSAYLDARARRFRLKVPKTPKEIQDKFGETLTVSFIAPGSTEDTSDIDMQFICEENPTACSELINTFQDVSRERLDLLKEEGAVPEGSLAEVFDTNPYPSGFVFRKELGSDLHFSDTYTERSMDSKKTADAGLALIRRLETPATNEQGERIDPIDQILATNKSKDPVAKDRQLRSLRTGVDVSLKSQHDRLAALLKGFPKAPEGAEDAHGKLVKFLKEAAEMNKTASWAPGASLSEPVLDDKTLKARLKLSEDIAKGIEEFSKALDKTSAGSGKAAVAKARNEVYLQSLAEVEELTRARDLALVDGVEKVSKLEEEIAQAGAKREDEKHKELFERYDKALEDTRSTSSALGVAAFVAQGTALNNADEAYFNRGAIGHVVEEQMGRQFVKTSGSAISSLEGNAGFILEHLAHDSHGESTVPKDEKKAKEELAKFAMATGKYIDRMAKALETLDGPAVTVPKTKPSTPPTEGSVNGRKGNGKCDPGAFTWIKNLGVQMSFLKKGKYPDGKGFIAKPEEEMEDLILNSLKGANINSLKELELKLEEVVNYAFEVNAQEDS